MALRDPNRVILGAPVAPLNVSMRFTKRRAGPAPRMFPLNSPRSREGLGRPKIQPSSIKWREVREAALVPGGDDESVV